MAEPEPHCGNCRFWPLSAYAQLHGLELGEGGSHTDGSASDCRRHAPREQEPDAHLHGSARWPTTRREDWCGDWDARPPGDPLGRDASGVSAKMRAYLANKWRPAK